MTENKDIQKNMSVPAIKKRLREYSSKEKARILQRFFKTGPGEYGEGDVFIGVMVPYARKVAKEFNDAPLSGIEELLKSPVHEERLTALLILVSKFKKASEKEKARIYRSYLKNYSYINNWDLVDLTAHHIIGGFLKDKDRSVLYSLAVSKNLWKRRMSVISTFHYFKDNDFKETIKIAQMLLNDEEDLIHKAVGWALREVGKRDLSILESFLDKNCKVMPRTMLRYAIERMTEAKRKMYMRREE